MISVITLFCDLPHTTVCISIRDLLPDVWFSAHLLGTLNTVCFVILSKTLYKKFILLYILFTILKSQTDTCKTGTDSSTVKRSTTGVRVTVLRDDHYKRMPFVTGNLV